MTFGFAVQNKQVFFLCRLCVTLKAGQIMPTPNQL